MKNSNDMKLTVLPLSVFIVLVILWKITQAAGAGVLVILFWISWRQLIKRYIKHQEGRG